MVTSLDGEIARQNRVQRICISFHFPESQLYFCEVIYPIHSIYPSTDQIEFELVPPIILVISPSTSLHAASLKNLFPHLIFAWNYSLS